ncbi:unnamed protein product [Chrysoparadoxa australica]
MEAMQPQEGSVAGPGQGSRQRQSQGQGQSQPGEAKDEGEHDKTALLLSAALALLRLLQANIYHIKVVAIPPGTVGLGWGSGSRPLGGLQEERNKPFAQRLLALLMDYVGGVLDVDGSTGQLEQLQVAVRAEAAEAIGIGLEIFYPQPADRAELLRCLLEQLVSDEHQAPVRAAGSEGGGDDRAADKAGLSCMIPSDLLGPSRSVLLSRVVRAICCTPRLMLDIIPEPARPVLSAQTLPRFIDATVRGSTEGSCWHCSLNVRPKAGDVVMRGPDWQWGNQDGQDKGAGYGLVVRVETLDKLRIMWSDGSVNVYRWGVLDAQGQRLFDVKIFRQWEGQGQRKPSSLRYSYDAVCAASQQSQGHAEGSVGDIMGYIFEAAPKAWLEGKEDELVAGEAVRLYKDFAEVFGAGGRQLEEEHACEALPKVLELLLQGWKKLSGDQGTEAAEASSAVLCLLLHLQSVLVGNDMTGAAEGARAGTQAREALTTPSHGGSDGEVHAFVGASGSTRVWDWKECRHCAAPTRVALPAEAHENAQARARPLSVDPSYCHSNLCLKGKGSQSEGFVIEQGSERGWGVALATVGFRRGSGVGAAAPLPVGCPYSALTAHCRWLLLELQAIMEQATAAGTLEAVQGALGHPVPAAGGLLRGAVAALTQWHMLGTEESEKLMGPVKAAVEASENMRAALKRVTDSRREDFDEAQACQEDLHQLLTLLACLAGKLLGGMISGGIGSRGSGEVQNDVLALARGGWTRAGEQDQAALMEGAGRDQLTVGPEPGIETGATDWMRSPLLAGGRTGEASGHRGTKRKTIKAFLNDLIENTEGTPACKLGAWVSKHVGENPILARLGGPQITRTIRGAVAVMLWHSGFAQCSHEMALALTPDRVAQSPPFFLLETWRKAGALRSWAKSSRDKGTPYDITAARVLARIDFLLELEPASPENAAQMLALVARFLRGPADVLALRSAQQAVEARARMREQGLCLLRSMLAAASAENSSGIKCALLLYLPPALRGLLQRLVALGPDSVALRSERESMAAAELTGNMQLPAKLDGHYLDTLDGCAATSKQRVRGAFEALYALLAEELDAAAQGGDHSLLLCLLDALGIVVREEDHSQLARLRIFTHLQELLDRTIAAANPMPVTSAGEAALDTAEWLSEARQPREDNPSAPTSHVLTQGIMKLVYLLAMPVAAASQEPSFQPPGAPPSMVRALSGPATLSHSVFQMLYTELKRILDGMRQRQKRRSRETAKADNAEEETLHRLEVLRDEAASLSLTRELQVILQEITMLLLCVSAADSCQRQLSRPRWIALLLRLLQIGLPYAQHRAFRLLRRLLPSCPPDILTPGPGDDWSIVATVKEDLTSVTVQSPTPGPAPFPPLAPAMVRATSLSSSSREGEIPARSLLCFVLDIIGEGFAAAPLVERYFEPGKGSGGGKGEVSDELVAYQGFELLQRGAPMVCEGVALLRTLLQHNEWRAVTSTLLEDALHRGSACLKQMAREAREAKLKEEAMEHLEGSGLGAPKKAFPSAAATTEHVNTLLRMLAALSVLGGQLNVLYPGGKAEVLPAESSSHSEGKSSRGPHVVLEGKLCTVMSLTLGEVMVEGERSDGSKVTCSLSPDRLQPVPEVDVEAPLLPPGLVKTALTTTRLWCLDPLYGHMFDSDCSRKEQHEGPGQAQGGRDSSSEESEPLAAVLTRKPLAMHVLLWLVRSSALRASQGLLMHSPTAWSCVRLLTADAAAGPTLLSLASTTSSCSGLGDLPVLEENLTALLAQWQHRVIEGRAQLVEAALSSRSERHGIKTESPPPIGSRSCSSTGAAKESTVDLLEDEGLGEEAEGGMPGQEIQGQALGGEAPPPDAFARQMSEMGFPLHWCQRALQETGNDIEVALNWILTNGELLAMEDSLRESIAEESESAGEGRSDSDQQVISLIGQAEDAIRRALSATSSISGADSGVAEGGSASATGQAERWQQGGSDSGASWPRVFHYDPHSTAFLNLRARPSLSAERVGAIFASEEVMAVGQCGEWLHIRYAGLDGSDDGEMEMDQDDDDDDENDQDDEEDEDDDDDEDEEGKQEDFQCEDCGVQHKAERLVWALRTASSRELLRPGPCAYNPQVAWERVSLNTPGSRPEESAPALTSIELDTPEVTSLAQGTEVLALGDEVRSSSGTSRVRLVLPVEGWASKKPNIMECLGPALSGDGDDEARLEDRMEDEAGGDLYNRDGRYFGARQGWLLPGATALAAAERQTKGRRSNLTGKSSVEEAWKALSVLPAAEAEARVMDMCHSLTIIQSRQLLLTLVLQAHMQVQVQGSEVADVLLNLFKGQGKEVSPAASAEQMVNFLRLILFRGWQPGWDALYRSACTTCEIHTAIALLDK